MGRSLHGEHLLLRVARLIILQPHFVGDQLVVRPVDEQEGQLGLVQRLLAGGGDHGISGDDPGPQIHGGEHGEDGDLVGVDEGRSDHVLGGEEGGVGDDAPGVRRQIQSGGHDHRGAAHALPIEEEGQVRMHLGQEMGPSRNVVPLLHTESNVLAGAFAMGAHVGIEDRIPLLIEMLGDQGELPGRPGPEPVDRHHKADGMFRLNELRRQGKPVPAGEMQFRLGLAFVPVHAQLHFVPILVSAGGYHGAGFEQLRAIPPGAAAQEGIQAGAHGQEEQQKERDQDVEHRDLKKS